MIKRDRKYVAEMEVEETIFSYLEIQQLKKKTKPEDRGKNDESLVKCMCT